MEEEKLSRYWKLRRAYNTLNLNYDVLKTESEYKDRVITRQKNEIAKLKEEIKKWQQPKQKKVEEKKTYNFGEKKTENINGKTLPVEFITPKYKEARNKAIELLESDKYKGILETSDFWILVNTYANKTKAMYSGLIISHDGCLKINDVLDEELKFKPECMTLDKDGYNGSLVFTYNCPKQGIYEVGEVSKDNCKNDYPYAMALKKMYG